MIDMNPPISTKFLSIWYDISVKQYLFYRYIIPNRKKFGTDGRIDVDWKYLDLSRFGSHLQFVFRFKNHFMEVGG